MFADGNRYFVAVLECNMMVQKTAEVWLQVVSGTGFILTPGNVLNDLTGDNEDT